VTTDRGRRARNIVLGARSLPEPLRAPFIDRVCRGDAALRAEVDSLLSGRAPEPDSFDAVIEAALQEQPAPAPAPPEPNLAARPVGPMGPAEPQTDAEPDHIGPYRILGRLGEGALGVVYHARQTEPIRRDVALKRFRADLDAGVVLSRFDVEREALALMNHPHIARILDTGSDAGGRPYVVMEHVDGASITAFCDHHRLTIPERLRLFLVVCDAVQHAHQRGVLHRNLKPSNVLVTDAGGAPTPMVADFGVAAAIADPLTTDGMATLDTMLSRTPAYMSPEQAGSSAASVDTRSDVYALGVLLFELLTGGLPLRLEGRSLDEAREAIATQPPTLPSAHGGGEADAYARGTTPSGLSRALRGRLDRVVAKALHKDPDQRFASVAHFAEALRSRAGGTADRTSEGSWRHRAGSFLRGHLLAVGLVAAVALTLIAFAANRAVSTARSERDRARAAEAVARNEAAATDQVTAFLERLFRGAEDPRSPGASLPARALLDRGVLRLRTEFQADSVLRGRLLTTMGELYHAIGLPDEADSLLREALAVRERSLGADHPDVGATLDLLGAAARDRGAEDAGLSYFERALAIRRAALGDSAAPVLESFRHVAGANRALGRLDTAEPFLRRALELARRSRGGEDLDVATDETALASLLTERGAYDEADVLLRHALATRRRLLAAGDSNLATTLDQLGEVAWRRGRYAEAESLCREARDLYRALHGEEDAALARADYRLARALRGEGNLVDAEAFYRSGLDMARRTLGNRGPEYATYLQGLGDLLVSGGRVAEAEPLLRHALAMRRRLFGGDDPRVAGSLEAMGELELARRRAWSAEQYFTQARTIRDSAQPAANPERATPLLGLARAALLRGDVAGATPLARSADSLRAAALGDAHPLTEEARAVYAECQGVTQGAATGAPRDVPVAP